MARKLLFSVFATLLIAGCSDSKPTPPDDGGDDKSSKPVATASSGSFTVDRPATDVTCESWKACALAQMDSVNAELGLSQSEEALLAGLCPRATEAQSQVLTGDMATGLSRLDLACQ